MMNLLNVLSEESKSKIFKRGNDEVMYRDMFIKSLSNKNFIYELTIADCVNLYKYLDIDSDFTDVITFFEIEIERWSKQQNKTTYR